MEKKFNIKKIYWKDLSEDEKQIFRNFLDNDVYNQDGNYFLDIYRDMEFFGFDFLEYIQKVVVEDIFWELFHDFFEDKGFRAENAGIDFLKEHIYELLPDGYYDFIKYLEIKNQINLAIKDSIEDYKMEKESTQNEK